MTPIFKSTEFSFFMHLALQRPKITGFNHLSLLQDNVRDTNITCVVTGNPKPDIQWKFNGQLKTFKNIAGIDKCNITNQGTYLQSGKPEKLILCKLDFSVHQGLYTCIAKNKLTTIEASRELIVQGMSSTMGSFFKFVHKRFRKTNILYPLMCVHMWTYQGVRNFSFLKSFAENFAYVLNGCPCFAVE